MDRGRGIFVGYVGRGRDMQVGVRVCGTLHIVGVCGVCL